MNEERKLFENGSEHRVVDQASGEAVPPNSGGVFKNHADGSQTRIQAPTGDPPCECERTGAIAVAAANASNNTVTPSVAASTEPVDKVAVPSNIKASGRT